MAVALKVQYFNNANDLAQFAANAANSVASVVAIVFDMQSNKHVLYYT
jgi:hypothetical protein